MKDKSILLVEDNVKLANYLKESLQEANYDVSIEKRGDRGCLSHHP
ncbi:hypothetical protein [Legionella micdadei]|uniref:Two-component system, OmpR family, response regulator RstA n=1 Tax=Legionella micdadei TaxID=451 RepID=A0A1G5FXC5_LEGMI|nr:hypothetical protein [Legionella micdadei]SCY43913.1 two-component system, OmpR family, response regulator RstA [Legionella micdadei]